MKKLTGITLLLLALLLVGTPETKAQTLFSIGPHFGIDLDQDATFIGAQARLGVAGFPLLIQPVFDYGLNEEQTYYRIEGNALYYIGERFTTRFTPYVGPGLAAVIRDTDSGDTDMDFGLNIVGGIEFRPPIASLVPFAEARYTLQPGTDPLAVRGGVLFRFGGGS